MRKWLVVDIAGLGWSLLARWPGATPALRRIASGGTLRPLAPPFPAVTCTSQATFSTGAPPKAHGIVGNGWFHCEQGRVSFWEQPDALVTGEKIWQKLRKEQPGAVTAMLFWQNSIASQNDVIVTPQPIHKHNGGMFQSCWSRPGGWYAELVRQLGPFKLQWYWGPLTSLKGSQWIAAATLETLREFQPTLALTYLPFLDYGQQKWGPADERSGRDLAALDALIGELCDEAARLGYDICLFGDYAIEPVDRVVAPNRVLRAAGLLEVRPVSGLEYLDCWNSRAFAVVDHQVAHVYLPRGRDSSEAAAEALSRTAGVAEVLGPDRQSELGIRHARSGELLLVAEKGAWFEYPWWSEQAVAPDFASHIDIHNKPGYDPLEMFMDWWRLRISANPGRIRGSHGRPCASEADSAVLAVSRPIPLRSGELPVGLHELADALLAAS